MAMVIPCMLRPDFRGCLFLCLFMASRCNLRLDYTGCFLCLFFFLYIVVMGFDGGATVDVFIALL